jgi:hypothetical protein
LRRAAGLLLVIVVVAALARVAGFDPFRDDGQQSTTATDCPLSRPGSKIGLTLAPSCATVASDTASDPDPLPTWGMIDCAERSRHTWLEDGGDSHLTGTGEKQANDAFRRLQVVDGDDVSGERCELGHNWRLASDPGTGQTGPGPTVLYSEGKRRVTFLAVRLPSDWNVRDDDWRSVMQMKQTQPYSNPRPAPMIELEVVKGAWTLYSDWSEPLWTAPAKTGAWVRFAFDVTYSRDPRRGSIRVLADLNGDGDAGDRGERSPSIRHATLSAETAGSSSDTITEGESIPSHLRVGVYHNPNYRCPPPAGCYVDYDNVQVIAP